jgi:hypothetical protein
VANFYPMFFIVKTMKGSLVLRLRYWSLTAALVCAFRPSAAAEPIPVGHMEGTKHDFLALQTEGNVLVGDLLHVVRGDKGHFPFTFPFQRWLG